MNLRKIYNMEQAIANETNPRLREEMRQVLRELLKQLNTPKSA